MRKQEDTWSCKLLSLFPQWSWHHFKRRKEKQPCDGRKPQLSVPMGMSMRDIKTVSAGDSVNLNASLLAWSPSATSGDKNTPVSSKLPGSQMVQLDLVLLGLFPTTHSRGPFSLLFTGKLLFVSAFGLLSTFISCYPRNRKFPDMSYPHSPLT